MYVCATEHAHADRERPKGRPKGRPRPRQPTRAAPALPLATACGRRRGRPVAYPPRTEPVGGISQERGGSSKVPRRCDTTTPRTSLSPRGSVRTATALPDRRNATAGPGPIRPRVRLAPHSGTDMAQAPRYPSLGTVLRSMLRATNLRASCEQPRGPEKYNRQASFFFVYGLWHWLQPYG